MGFIVCSAVTRPILSTPGIRELAVVGRITSTIMVTGSTPYQDEGRSNHRASQRFHRRLSELNLDSNNAPASEADHLNE